MFSMRCIRIANASRPFVKANLASGGPATCGTGRGLELVALVIVVGHVLIGRGVVGRLSLGLLDRGRGLPPPEAMQRRCQLIRADAIIRQRGGRAAPRSALRRP